MGLMFKGEVTKQAISAICSAYGAGDPDSCEPRVARQDKPGSGSGSGSGWAWAWA